MNFQVCHQFPIHMLHYLQTNLKSNKQMTIKTEQPNQIFFFLEITTQPDLTRGRDQKSTTILLSRIHLTNRTKKEIEITQRHEPMKKIQIRQNFRLSLGN
jgi:hypothetical protein